jgi:hypothetical protein
LAGCVGGRGLGRLLAVRQQRLLVRADSQCYDASGKVSQGWVRQSQDPIGSFSVAAVPGMSAGQAWRNTAIQSRTTEVAITGYLTRVR